MTMKESARSLLKIAYRHLDPKTAVLDLTKFWDDATEAGIELYQPFLSKRSNADQLLRTLERRAEAVTVAALYAEIPNHDRTSYNEYVGMLAREGRLPVLVEHQRQTIFVKDMRLAVGTLYDSQRR